MRKSDLLDEDYKIEEAELLGKDVKELPIEMYTLIATAKIRRAEEDRELQDAILKGDKEKFEEFLADLSDNQWTWGDHLKRYISDTASGGKLSVSDISDEMLMTKIYNAFAYNGMADRGSIHPGTETSLQTRLPQWIAMPANRLDRETCFLFAFGLNMNEEWTSYLLTDVLRKADFNPRSPEEAIYYYCLYNNGKYYGVKKWLQKYEQVLPKERTKYLYTKGLDYDLRVLAEEGNDDAFLGYLAELKNLEQKQTTKKHKFSDTKAKVFNRLLTEVYCAVSEEKEERWSKEVARYEAAKREVDQISQPAKYKREEARRAKKAINRILNKGELEDLEVRLLLIPGKKDIPVSEKMQELFDEKIIWIPSFTPGSIKKQIEDKTTEIKREDILLAAFILAAYDKGCEMYGKDYETRVNYFTYMADYWLEKAGFGEFYFLGPFELFLTICLLQDNPFKYVLGVWKKYRVTRKKKDETKENR